MLMRRVAGSAPTVPFISGLRFKASHVKIANRKKVEMFEGKRFQVPTRLRTAAPLIAMEWNYKRNKGFSYPEIIGIGSMEPVWWECSKCGEEFEMSCEKRVVRGKGCPRCSANPPPPAEEELLDGEKNAALQPKRPMMLNIRTKY
ncbi:Probable Zinc-ribbon domain containing protein, putative [Angomonas deanei]|uniref:Probable Zinc-ribbon domain containing protein, putative n=1 Tax=Angomonas deanei TaxID=59799 RepID=A0A7G2C569_9TRYP|nr:Probable Zinc-ribbon domain containing protein, putative [Angomonas deanei]